MCQVFSPHLYGKIRETTKLCNLWSEKARKKAKTADYTPGELEDMSLILLPASAGLSADGQNVLIIVEELWTRLFVPSVERVGIIIACVGDVQNMKSFF